MAERVFSTLGHWVTLDDAALDAAIKRSGHCASERKTAEVGAPTVCLRAGDAGRTEGADHPRAVHAAAAAIPVRGQRAGALCRARRPRPERDDGARQSRGVSGGLAPPRQRDRPALRTAMASAADVTFKEVVREACLSRDHFMAWTDDAGSAHAAARADLRSAGRRSRRPYRGCRARHRRWAEPAAIALGGDRRAFSTPAARPTRIRPPGFAQHCCSPARRRSTNISACSSPRPSARRANRW